MKAVQVMMDEALLARLDADDEVRAQGRSAVLRNAVAEYLRRRDEQRIADAYRRAYTRGGLGPEWDGWEEQGEWPEK
jgi:predicted transcriptional regulator